MRCVCVVVVVVWRLRERVVKVLKRWERQWWER